MMDCSINHANHVGQCRLRVVGCVPVATLAKDRKIVHGMVCLPMSIILHFNYLLILILKINVIAFVG